MVIIGAKGCAMEILTALEWDGRNNDVVFFDNVSSDLPALIFDRYPVIQSWKELRQYFKTESNEVIVGVGGAGAREVLARKAIALGGSLTTFISAKAALGKYENNIGAGVVVLSQSIITVNTSIGRGTLINKNVTVSHDARIGCFCELSPGARILGKVTIGDRCEIGTNAVILPGMTIGSDCKIGAGAIVTKDVESFTTVAGVPAKARPPAKKKFSFFKLKSKLRNTLYHFKIADFSLLRKYNIAIGRTAKLPWRKLLLCSWRHGASFQEYYEYQFYDKTRAEIRTHITTSLRHELTRQVNDSEKAQILKDKSQFARFFHDRVGREIASYREIEKNLSGSAPFTMDRIILKPAHGQLSRGIFVPDNSFGSWREIYDFMTQHLDNPEEYICEEFIRQHPSLDKLNPSCVNVLRILTFYDESMDAVEVWSVRLRMGINGLTKSYSAIVDDDGIIRNPAADKAPVRVYDYQHPVTKENIVGFEVPFYKEAVGLAIESAMRIKEVRSIGWDIAITENGPILVEGNDNWSISEQIPHNCGLRHLANTVCDMFAVYE